MPFPPDIVSKLLELKQDSGLTYEQIGLEVRTSDTNVRRYINGEVKTPDRKLLFAIVRAIGGDPDELFAPKPRTILLISPLRKSRAPLTASSYSLWEILPVQTPIQRLI